MNDRLARFLAYGLPWAVLMSLPPLTGLWAIPVALAMLAVVWVGCDWITARRERDALAAYLRHQQQRQRRVLPHTLDPEA